MARIAAPLISALLLFGLAACAGPDKDGISGAGSPAAGEASLRAKIITVSDGSLLIANMGEDASSADIYWIRPGEAGIRDADGKETDAASLRPGMLLDIAFDGAVMESFPAQLGRIFRIAVTGQGDDIAGLYGTVIDDLYKEDTAPQSGAERLAFDLTGVANLTETEKTALVYMLGSQYELEAFQATFDELMEQGYVDADGASFDGGLLFTIADSPTEDGEITFRAEIWYGNLGAHGFADCTARRTEDGAWTTA